MTKIKSNSINKKSIKYVNYIKYKEYIRFEDISEKYKITKAIGKLKEINKIPDFENILKDLLIILPYENNEKLLLEKDWIEIWIVI